MAPPAPSRLCLVPRWGGRPETAWYRWARAELLGRGAPYGAVEILEMPEPDQPTVDGWVEHLAGCLGRPPATPKRLFLAGHSVGCQAILRYLATLPAGVAIGGALFVAGWWAVDEPWDSIRPWIERPLDLGRARAAARRFEVLLSEDDPFTPDWRASAARFSDRLCARVRVERAAGHFDGESEPAVLEALLALGA